MLVLEQDAPPELPRHHAKSMKVMLLFAIFAIACILIPTKVFNMELHWFMGIPMFCMPLAFLILAGIRSSSAKCPHCSAKMTSSKYIEVVSDIPVWGRHAKTPSFVVSCKKCDTHYRIPGIVPDNNSLSKKAYSDLLKENKSFPTQ